jgi:hypothetical protein
MQMGVLDGLVAAAAGGRLDALAFARAWRARRSFGPYLRAILTAAEASGHPRREIGICRSVTARLKAPRFRRRLTDLLAAEAEAELSRADPGLAGGRPAMPAPAALARAMPAPAPAENRAEATVLRAAAAPPVAQSAAAR